MLRKVKGVICSIAPAAAVFAGNVYAEVPAAVTTALDTAKADATTVAGTVLTIIIAIMAFMFIRKALR